MTVGVAARSAFNYGWHTYSWSTYQPPADTNLSWGAWSSFSAGPEADPTALAGSGVLNYNGYVTVVWGTRPGAYTGRMVVPIWTTAGATFNYRITGLRRNTTYYLNAFANIPSITVVGGIPQSGLRQFGEISASTAPVPPTLVAPQTADNSAGSGNVAFQIGTNVACTGYIEWGLTTAYGTRTNFTGGTGLGGAPLVCSITGTVGQTYHWRAVVTGVSAPNNVTTTGPDHSVGPLT